MNSSNPNTVTLLNGAKVSPGQVLVILGTLKNLLDKGLHGQILLRGLHVLCQDADFKEVVDEGIVQTLVGEGLLQATGVPCECVKDVMVSAVVKNEDLSLLKLRKPYQEIEANLAALRQVANKAIDELDLGEFLRLS